MPSDDLVEHVADFRHAAAPGGYGCRSMLEWQVQQLADALKALALEWWIDGSPVPAAVSGWRIE